MKRVFLATLIVFCLSVSSSAEAQQKTGKTKQTPKRSTPGKDTSDKKDLIQEAASFVLNPTGVEPTGAITIESVGTDCRQVRFSAQVVLNYDGAGGALPQAGDVLYYPAVKHTYVGHVCLPDKGASFNARINLDILKPKGSSARMGFRDGAAVASNGPINVTGTVSMAVADNAPVFEIESDPSDQLVLVLTNRGYKYVSGKGTVKAPNGKLYDFRGVSEKRDAQLDRAVEPGPILSPDSKRLAYVGSRGEKHILVADGKEGLLSDGVALPTFSPDSRRVAYGVKRDGKFFLVIDGMEKRWV